MLKRITIHAINCFVSLLFLLIMSSSCINIDQSENQRNIYPAGPSWKQFDESCLQFYRKDGKDLHSKVIMFRMLYAKTDIGADRDASLDIKERFRYRIPIYNKLLKDVFDQTTRYWQNGLGIPTGSDETFRYLFYEVIAGNAVRVSPEDIYHMIRWGGLVIDDCKNYSPCSYSKVFATTLLQAYENPQYKKLLDSVSRFWFIRLRAACVLGDVSMAKEILNKHSNECQKQGYNRLLRDACRCNQLEMVKFLISNIISQNNKHVQIQEIDFGKLLAIAKEKNHQECIAYLESMNDSDHEKFQLRDNRKLAEKKKFEEQELVNIYQIAAKSASDMKQNYISYYISSVPYSEAYAKALLQAYANPGDQSLFNQIDKFWFIRLRAACTLGDIAKVEEILNEYSEKCKSEDYILLVRDACFKDNPDLVKFLLPAVNSNEFRSNLAETFQMMQELSRLKEHEATIVGHQIGLNKAAEMIKTAGMGTMFMVAIGNSNGRCLPLLLEKFPLDTKSLVFLMEIAVKLKDNPNAAGNVLCLIKKFEASRDHADKNHFIDCSTLLIQGNTAVLKELMRAGIQISLASLPAIIADNGPKVLASIDAVMVGKTPLMLASKEMDQAMLAAAAVGNVKVLKKLVQYGGEVNCMDENEKSPLAIAKENNHQECVAYLESVNAVSSKFQLRNIRREIAAKREKFAANLGIKQYRDDLFRRQLQMLKGLSGKERLLVRTLLQAKIHDNLNLRKLQKLRELANIGGSGAELETILLNKTRLDTTFIYLTFARVQVLKTEDPNRFEILIYPELTPSSKQMIHDIELRITKNQASWNDQVVYDLIRNVNWSENGKNITVLLDGDVIRILKSPPEIIINFRTPPVSSGRKSVNRARNSVIPYDRESPAGMDRP